MASGANRLWFIILVSVTILYLKVYASVEDNENAVHTNESLNCTFEEDDEDIKKACFIENQRSDNSEIEIFVSNDSERKKTEVLRVRGGEDFKFLPKNIAVAFPNLIKIIVHATQIKEVSKEEFKNLRKLQILDLSELDLETIQEGSFDDLIELKSLYLNGNQIRNLDSKLFASLEQLWKIDLSYNKLEKLDDDLFANNTKLAEINLSHNELSYISPKLFKTLEQLEAIYLSGNKLERLDDDLFANNRELKTIHLSRTELSYISPKLFKNLEQLVILTLSNNKLERLDDDLFANNSKLIQISLSENKLSYISPKAFKDKKNLFGIDLRKNTCIDTLYFFQFINLDEDLKNCTSGASLESL